MRPADSWKDYELLDATGGNRPSATAFAIASVFPVELQYTTATLLILIYLILSIYAATVS